MKVQKYPTALSAVLAAVFASAMFVLPASGQNNPPPPPGLPTIGKKPVPPSPGLPKPLRPQVIPQLQNAPPKPQRSNPVKIPLLPKPVPQTSASGVRMITSSSLGVASTLQLDGAVVCMQYTAAAGNNSVEVKVQNYFDQNGIALVPLTAEDIGELKSAFLKGQCDVLALDALGIENHLSELNSDGGDFIILPETIQ